MLAKEGIFLEPASAASVAGLIKNKNRIQKESTIVCVLTGNGLKDPDCAIQNNDAVLEKILSLIKRYNQNLRILKSKKISVCGNPLKRKFIC